MSCQCLVKNSCLDLLTTYCLSILIRLGELFEETLEQTFSSEMKLRCDRARVPRRKSPKSLARPTQPPAGRPDEASLTTCERDGAAAEPLEEKEGKGGPRQTDTAEGRMRPGGGCMRGQGRVASTW